MKYSVAEGQEDVKSPPEVKKELLERGGFKYGEQGSGDLFQVFIKKAINHPW